MMEELAKVVASDNGWVRVEVELKSACNHCTSSQSCGTSAVAKAFSVKTQQFSIASDESFEAGELLKLGLPESVILKAAALVYLLPLLGFFSFATLGNVAALLTQFSTDAVTIVFGSFGGGIAWYIGRYLAKRIEHEAQPVIVSRLGAQVSLTKSTSFTAS